MHGPSIEVEAVPAAGWVNKKIPEGDMHGAEVLLLDVPSLGVEDHYRTELLKDGDDLAAAEIGGKLDIYRAASVLWKISKPSKNL